MAEFKVRISITQEYTTTIRDIDTEDQAKEKAMRTPVATVMKVWDPVGYGGVNGILAIREVVK